MNEGQLGELFESALGKLEDWYADPNRSIDYENRPPVRSGKHGESTPAFPASRPLINWRAEWRGACVAPDPVARKREILWAILYELDPRAPATVEGKDFYGQVSYKAAAANRIGRPLTQVQAPARRRT